VQKAPLRRIFFKQVQSFTRDTAKQGKKLSATGTVDIEASGVPEFTPAREAGRWNR